MPALPVREAKRRESWRSLQAAAVELVGRRGFTAVTVDDIAAAAGVSRRTFFNHFATKAAVLFDPDPEDAERLERLLAEADGAADVWAALGGVWLSYLTGHRHLLAVRRRLVDDPELSAYQRTAYRHVEASIAGWMHRQLPGDAYLAALVAYASGAVVGAAFTAWSPDQPPEQLLELAGRGFRQLAGAVVPTSDRS
ncbi:TetR family transcriptional regulator [Blastococcus sp. SYSU D00669]